MTDYEIFSEVFTQFTFSTNKPNLLSNKLKLTQFTFSTNKLLNNWLCCLYEKHNPSVVHIDFSSVGLYVRTLDFIFFLIDSPTSYY